MQGSIELPTAREGNQLSGNFLVKLFELTGSLLPKRTRRFVFLFSVIGHLDQATKDDEGLVSALNEVLNLPNSPEVCQQCINAESMIWRGVSTDFSFMDTTRPWSVRRQSLLEDKEKITDHFLDNCPKWLRYADLGDMKRDLYHLFNVVSLRTF